MTRHLQTVLSCGLNLLIERLGVDPAYARWLWLVIAANELRGLAVVWQFGAKLLRVVG